MRLHARRIRLGRTTVSRSDLDAGTFELPGGGPRVDVEPDSDHLEGLARLVASRCLPDRSVRHLADELPAFGAAAIEVVDDRRPVDTESFSQRVDRRPVSVGAAEHVDVVIGQPPLHRV